MFALLKMELKNSFNSLSCKVISTLLWGICLASFLTEVSEQSGQHVLYERAAGECVFLQSANALYLSSSLLLVFPLLASLLYAGSKIEEEKKGITGNIISRVGRLRYILSKGIAVFLSTFLVFFIPLIANLILCYVCFPVDGSNSMWLEPKFTIGLSASVSGSFMNFWRIQYPLMYNIFAICVYCIGAGLVAFLAYGISFKVNKNGNGVLKMTFITTFLILMSRLLFTMIGKGDFTLQNYMLTVQIGSWYKLILIALLYILFSIFCIVTGRKKEL